MSNELPQEIQDKIKETYPVIQQKVSNDLTDADIYLSDRQACEEGAQIAHDYYKEQSEWAKVEDYKKAFSLLERFVRDEYDRNAPVPFTGMERQSFESYFETFCREKGIVLPSPPKGDKR